VQTREAGCPLPQTHVRPRPPRAPPVHTHLQDLVHALGPQCALHQVCHRHCTDERSLLAFWREGRGRWVSGRSGWVLLLLVGWEEGLLLLGQPVHIAQSEHGCHAPTHMQQSLPHSPCARSRRGLRWLPAPSHLADPARGCGLFAVSVITPWCSCCTTYTAW